MADPRRETAPATAAATPAGSGGAAKADDAASIWYVPLTTLQTNTPSRMAGISYEQETEYRVTVSTFLKKTGLKLKLPMLTIATAMAFFHRFFLRQSFSDYERWMIAVTCLFLAGKVEETPKKLEKVVKVAYEGIYKGNDGNKPWKERFKEMKEQILIYEREVLQTIAFDLTVEHPYKPLLKFVKRINGSKELAQVAWNFANDSLRTTLALQFPADQVAAGAIFLASKFLSLPLPDDASTTFDVPSAVMEAISQQILDIYENTDGAPGGMQVGGGSANSDASKPGASGTADVSTPSRGDAPAQAAPVGAPIPSTAVPPGVALGTYADQHHATGGHRSRSDPKEAHRDHQREQRRARPSRGGGEAPVLPAAPVQPSAGPDGSNGPAAQPGGERFNPY